MSLRDTIAGARSEASQASGKPAAAPSTAKKGSSKKSSANARPAREKAASVRTASKSGKKGAAAKTSMPWVKKTKEQKEAEKAERRKQREEEDVRSQAYQVLLSQNPVFKRSERIWWILLGIGFIATLVSLALSFMFPITDGDYSTPQGIASIVSLATAYLFIIASFVYEWIARRPVRKEVEKKLQGMSNKKVAEILAAERKAALERKAAKEAAKAEKKAKK